MASQSKAIVNIESCRWSSHYLDASTADEGKARPGKGNVYVTKGNPGEDWAKWKINDCGNGEVTFESIRWSQHFLDASFGDFSDGGAGKGNVYVTKGNPTEDWARWKITKKAGDTVWIESVRWPGHYLDASTGEVGKGNVYVTRPHTTDRNPVWASWRINVIDVLYTLPFTNMRKPFPKHWGEPPRVQTKDYCELPGGYGFGSGTLRMWIEQKMAEDALS